MAVKDLLFRRRRFVTSVLATSIAFGLALLLAGTEAHLRAESERIVRLFAADQFVVATGSAGPFSTTRLLPTTMAHVLRADPGVERADPFVQVREVVGSKDVNVLGLTPDGAGWPEPAEGRLPAAPGEVVVDELLGASIGDAIEFGGRDATVVGISQETRRATTSPCRRCSPRSLMCSRRT